MKSLKQWIVRWLGVEEVLIYHAQAISRANASAESNKVSLDRFLQAAKAFDELSPERKAESDKLGDAVIGRLIAEDMARRHTEGKL